MGGKEMNMYLGGNVWEDMPTTEIGKYEGRRIDDKSLAMAGIQVELWDNTHNKLVAKTMTDINGTYGFQKINPLLKYRVIFTYDGMKFEDTDYNNNLSGGWSTALEDYAGYNGNPIFVPYRDEFNDLFDQIGSSPQNYQKGDKWRRAYGLYTKLENEEGDYIPCNNNGPNAGAFRYYDALEILKQIAIAHHTFNSEKEVNMQETYYKVGTGLNSGYYEPVKFRL